MKALHILFEGDCTVLSHSDFVEEIIQIFFSQDN